MVTVLKAGTTEEQKRMLIKWFEDQGLRVHEYENDNQTVLGLIGDTSGIDVEMLELLDIVEHVALISEPFKKANRKFHPEDSVIDVGGRKIGGGSFAVIAGPCSVETEEQIIEVAKAVKASGATMLRGGAFKPRTSPYDFQGLKAEGLKLLLEAKRETGLPIVTEIMNQDHLDLFEDVDVIQVGARNMQNFELLKELGRTDKPILLKRGLANTIKELLMSAEYIMSGGNENVILCERGIRTFETYTRNTLDLSVIPVLHNLTHLPVVVDPSHATGHSDLVEPMAMAATAGGADGLMIEVHNNPPMALCDGAQSLTPLQFEETMKKVRRIREVVA
ncbi:3-deoxy-7-phosphoheptulonate synthase [Hornefia butyriciproducens]|uniref:3-deoxy-7-phosphoheptulonate synthase n=1 Tax=Hornefia butyriciproducens TaxID=2652293 RepID=A0A6L5Y7U5_9FIRM|nr:3-deoxy-7-phosphoheptulonate synthase [Hornefia butyriciproducens]MCI7679238.1 3-deoxy-7-phosphoheptulonate synthase [Clostridiales bacterium]MDY5423234.1 3-deoxy-7-phosphoheptulonate synthase [Hornefia butyriciproducens]MDY5463280.1 3-deoxy-7-phosphoheptulonate synthase [Hornefia butyriciproducens]MST52671.1 3-deoxy-7-phosphoheptulonate synthase [Hornefia butyriciproducens]